MFLYLRLLMQLKRAATYLCAVCMSVGYSLNSTIGTTHSRAKDAVHAKHDRAVNNARSAVVLAEEHVEITRQNSKAAVDAAFDKAVSKRDKLLTITGKL